MGLAVSHASGSMQFLENGSHNKRLHPGMAAYNAFVAVAMAQAGALGAAKPLEGKFGLVKAYTDTPDAQIDVAGLGRTWKFVDTALKPYPACRLTHSMIELAGKFGQEGKSRPVESIRIAMHPASYPVIGVPVENKVHPNNVVDAQFSVYYQTAASWLHGSDQGWSIYDRLGDAAVHELCSKIVVEKKDMPNQLSASMSVTWQDGHKKSEYLEFALWEPEREPQDEEVQKKFRLVARGVLGEKRAGAVIHWVMGSMSAPVAGLVELLE
jgi:2-methylcitrate dehydratase PrpD